ncbi:MAG: hypothetical protein N3G74_02350 [Candidatus Micrarchaeota archaeon]|nr:hypothetical protein [Candidatus Micrarchaeota archaeon]
MRFSDLHKNQNRYNAPVEKGNKPKEEPMIKKLDRQEKISALFISNSFSEKRRMKEMESSFPTLSLTAVSNINDLDKSAIKNFDVIIICDNVLERCEPEFLFKYIKEIKDLYLKNELAPPKIAVLSNFKHRFENTFRPDSKNLPDIVAEKWLSKENIKNLFYTLRLEVKNNE